MKSQQQNKSATTGDMMEGTAATAMMSIGSFLALPDQLLVEILSQWITIKDFSRFDVAICERKARDSFLVFLFYHSLFFEQSTLKFSNENNAMTYYPTNPSAQLDYKSDFRSPPITIKERRPRYLALRYCAKRNISVGSIDLVSWPFFDMEPAEWTSMLKNFSSLHLSIQTNIVRSIKEHGWGAYLSEFRSFGSIQHLTLSLKDAHEHENYRIQIYRLLRAAQLRWKQPLKSLTLLSSKSSYVVDKFRISPICKFPLSEIIPTLANLHSLRLEGQGMIFKKNVHYMTIISDLASFQDCQLETLVIDICPVYRFRSERASTYVCRNIETLLEKPQKQRNGLEKLTKLEGVDCFIYPVLFLAPNLLHLRLHGGDVMLIGIARHLARQPHDTSAPSYHANDEEESVEEFDDEDDDEISESSNSESGLFPARDFSSTTDRPTDNHQPWPLPTLSNLRTLHINADGRPEMMYHRSIPFIIGPFMKRLNCLSTLKSLSMRLSLATDVPRCDIIDYFQSVIDDRNDGILPADTCSQLRKIEVPDFVYLQSSLDASKAAGLMEATTAASISDMMEIAAKAEDRSLCKLIASFAPAVAEISYHPERDRDTLLYHSRRFRLTSLLPVASTLTSLHVDEVYRIMVPQFALRNELVHLTAFQHLQHLTLRDSGLHFSDEELLPVLQALPQLQSLVISILDYLNEALEEGREYRYHPNELAEENDQEYRGHPKSEIDYDYNPVGFITLKTLQVIASHNRNLRVLILDLPCFPEIPEVIVKEMKYEADRIASETNMDAAMEALAINNNGVTEEVVDKDAVKAVEVETTEEGKHDDDMILDFVEYNPALPSIIEKVEAVAAALLNLMDSLPHVKIGRHLFARMEYEVLGPSLWNWTTTAEDRSLLRMLRSNRWLYRRDIRTSLFTKLEARNSLGSNMRIEVMESPLKKYRYDDHSSEHFMTEVGYNIPESDNEDSEIVQTMAVSTALLSANEEEPDYSDASDDDEHDDDSDGDSDNSSGGWSDFDGDDDEDDDDEDDDEEEEEDDDDDNAEGFDDDSNAWSDVD